MTNLRLLRILVALLALIPLGTGLVALLGVHDPIYQLDANLEWVILDSNLRFFGGVWLVVGIALIANLNRLYQPNPLFQWLLAAVVSGGVGRLLSMLFFALPPWPFIAFTLLELTVIPCLMLWQHRLAVRTTQA